LFTGEKGVGKSTAIRRVVEAVGTEHFVGFLAGEQRHDGRRTGFQIRMLDGREGTLASVQSDSELRIGGPDQSGRPRYGVELGFLEEVAVPALRAALSVPERRLLVIDEIGPMQLFSNDFKAVVFEALASDVFVVGTIVLRSLPWTDRLKTHPEIETFLLTEQNRETLTEMMVLYVERLVST
jgi:nucleoside-triphosphatase